ncbi:871_t:CDS:1, partial [Gigaspora margarita]
VYLIKALPVNLTKGQETQETTTVPHEHKFVEHTEHKELEKRTI